MSTIVDERNQEAAAKLRQSTVEELLAVVARKRGQVTIDSTRGSAGDVHLTVMVQSTDGRTRFEGESHDGGRGPRGLRAHLADALVECFEAALEYAEDRDAADTVNHYAW